MSPGVLISKHLQESGSSNRSGRPATGIFYIGKITFDQLGILLPQGELPESFATPFASFK